MYAKVFASMFDGTLVEHWEAWTTFVAILALCDADGVLDMTPAVLTKRCGLPAEVVEKGLAILAAPDPQSRSKGEEGRRIIPLDPDRAWGWSVVNHRHYQTLKDANEIRRANRERQARFRERHKVTEPNAGVTPANAGSHNTDTDTYTRRSPTDSSCADLLPESTPAVVERIPLNDGSEYPVNQRQVDEWARLYPAVRVVPEIRKMRGWCLAKRANRKTRRGVMAFINSWLAREQDKARPAPGAGTRAVSDAEYLEQNMGGKS